MKPLFTRVFSNWKLVAASMVLLVALIIGVMIFVSKSEDATVVEVASGTEATSQASPSTEQNTAETTDSGQETTSPETPAASTSTTPNAASPTSGGGGSSPSPSPSPTPPPIGPACNGQTHVAGGNDGIVGCWPGPDNTGVPDGVVLSAYSGPTSFSSGTTVIDGKLINDDLFVSGTGNLTVKNSKMVGHFDADTASGSLTIIDSEIDGTSWVGATVGFQNVTIVRSNIYGSQHSVLCGDNCSVADSWLHSQYEHNGDHNNAYISNGGSNVTLRHNTLHCTPTGSAGGGCSSNASFFGDFAVISNITIDKNLLLATPSGGYCAYLGHDPGKPYGSNPSNVSVTNNYFQKGTSGKCGIHAPVTSFLNANGNVFSGNKYTDGTTVSY